MLISCEKDNSLTLHYSDFDNLTLMDPYEDYNFNNVAQDTVYYFFKADSSLTKIRYDYSIENNQVYLEKMDTIECIFYLNGNSLVTTSFKLDETINLSPQFGKDYAEWKVLTLNVDTMIVDAYAFSEQHTKVGHWGFSVQ